MTKVPFKEEMPGGVALGILEDSEYDEKEIKLSPGDLLLIYTDGVTEAMDAENQLYGIERMTHVARAFSHESPQRILDEILEDTSRFSNGREQHDDITLIVIKASIGMGPTGPDAMAGTARRVITREEDVPELRSYLSDNISSWGFENEKILDMQLAVEEACLNIFHYAYGGKGGNIVVTIDRIPDGAIITLEDKGPGFDPTKACRPDLGLKMEEMPIGGLGIHLIRSLTDDMRYEFKDGKNRLILVKKGNPIRQEKVI